MTSKIFSSKILISLVIVISTLVTSSGVWAATNIGPNILTDGQIGIGTGATALWSRLDIGNWTSGGAVHLGDNYTGSGDAWGGSLPAMVISDGGSNRSSFYVNSGATYLGAETISDVHLMTGNAPGLTLNSFGNVGIGTTNLTENWKLKLYANSPANGLLIINDGGSAGVVMNPNSLAGGSWKMEARNDVVGLSIWNGTNERLRIDGNGNVGIGSVTPTSKLQVVGDDVLYSTIFAVNNTTASGYAGVDGKSMNGPGVAGQSSGASAAGVAGTGFYGVYGTGLGAGSYGGYFANPGGSYGLVVETGNVGIGITTPVELLDVNGALKLGTTANTNAGTLRWTGIDFEGYDGSSWLSLTSAGAPVGATYITQTADGTLTNEQALSALTTGLVKNTTGTGVLSIATAGTDYEDPLIFSAPLSRSVNTISVTADSIGDTELAYNTGQHLTTTSSPTFAGLTLSSALTIANGGTGQTTANAAFNALAPSQAINAGKFLTTDGTNTSWATVSDGWHGSTTRIKLLPHDFHSTKSDRNLIASIAAPVGAYVTTTDNNADPFIMMAIPAGYQATNLMVYGDTITNTVAVYVNDLADNTTSTIIGSGVVGTEIDITDTSSSATNYISIYVDINNANQIWGGYITIIKL